MKHRAKVIGITSAVVLIALIALIRQPIKRMESWREDYGKAEPLVQTIWPMAQSMRAYEEKFGRGPASLEDLVAFDPELSVFAIAPYKMILNPEGRRRFFIRVNRRFAFEIDDQFKPSWVDLTGTMQSSREP